MLCIPVVPTPITAGAREKCSFADDTPRAHFNHIYAAGLLFILLYYFIFTTRPGDVNTPRAAQLSIVLAIFIRLNNNNNTSAKRTPKVGRLVNELVHTRSNTL